MGCQWRSESDSTQGRSSSVRSATICTWTTPSWARPRTWRARMEQMAKPGSVLTTADTFRLAEGYVAMNPLGPVPVKGLADPVQIYEVTGAGAARTRLQAAAGRGLTRFVGRDMSNRSNSARAQQLAGQGHGQVVAIVGEAGVGKSRLVHEFRSLAPYSGLAGSGIQLRFLWSRNALPADHRSASGIISRSTSMTARNRSARKYRTRS